MRHLNDQQLLDAVHERGIDIHDIAMLRMALTHNSAVPNATLESNERLEFLGDAVLGQVIAMYLFERLPGHDEGALAKARSLIVCKSALAAAAIRLDVRSLLWLGVKEEAMGGRNRASLIADAYEALVAVITLTRGWEAARDFILRTLSPEIEAVHTSQDWRDPKTALQELCQSTGEPLPDYQIVEEHGRPHDRTFTAEVALARGLTAQGTGKTKKEAEQAAAELLLKLVKGAGRPKKTSSARSPGRR